MNNGASKQECAYRDLLSQLRAFARSQSVPGLKKLVFPEFDRLMVYSERCVRHYDAAKELDVLSQVTCQKTDALVRSIHHHQSLLHWEQSYTKSHSDLIGNMLERYAFAEIVGKQGPFLSDTIRAGIAVYGPEIRYPPHSHVSEEYYVVLAGSALFQCGSEPYTVGHPGKAMYHPSNHPHSLKTQNQAVMIFYVWGGGDLRETPRFN